MTKVRTSITIDKDLFAKAKKYNISISSFLDIELRKYIAILEGKYSAYPMSNDTSSGPIVRRGGDLNSRSPNGEPALKAGAVGRTLLPRQQIFLK